MIVPCGIRLASSLLTFFSEYLINSPLHYFLNKMEILGCIRLLCVYQCCVTNHPKTQRLKTTTTYLIVILYLSRTVLALTYSWL